MEHSETMEKEVGFSLEEMLRSNSFKQNGIGTNSITFDEKIIAECDSDWDDIIAQLSISRMVNNSIVKGIVEDAADIIAEKEDEVVALREKLRIYEADVGPSRISLVRPNNLMLIPYTENSDFDTNLYINHVHDIRFEVEEQLKLLNENLQRLQNSGLNTELCKTCPEENQNSKKWLHEVDQSVNALQVVLVAGFEQISQMVCSKYSELQWLHDLKEEINGSLIQDYIIELQKEYNTKLYEQSVLEKKWKERWQAKLAELETLRTELHVILEELNIHENSEKGTLLKRNDQFRLNTLGDNIFPSKSEENFVEALKISGDSGDDVLDIADFHHLKQMQKEDLISYFKSEMTKLKRQHELTLQEKTEVFFRHYRKLLNENGSSPLKKEKTYRNLKGKLPKFISMLDKILEDKDISLSTIKSDDMLTSLKDKFDLLYSDNKRLKFLLVKKTKEIKEITSLIETGHNSLHPSRDSKYVIQINKLEMDLEDTRLEAALQFDLLFIIMQELINEHRHNAEDIKINLEGLIELYTIIFKEIVSAAISTLSSRVSKIHTEKSSAEALLFEKDKVLKMEIEEKMKLKEELVTLLTFMKEKENFASEAKSELTKDKKQLNLLQQELHMLKETIRNQEGQISDLQLHSTSANERLQDEMLKIQIYEQDINKLNEELIGKSATLDEVEKKITELLQRNQYYEHETSRLNEKLKLESDALEKASKENSMLLHQIKQYAVESSKLDVKLKVASEALEQVDKKNTELLHQTQVYVQENAKLKEKLKVVSDALVEAERNNTLLFSSTQKHKEQKKLLKFILTFVQQLSGGLPDLEIQLRNIEKNESRLDVLNQKLRPLVQQAGLHKKMLEIRCSDLQKAEAEVDILADEVEALYVLLGKIYLTLDHYSPVLQHYSGVMEILKLVRRQLNGENS